MGKTEGKGRKFSIFRSADEEAKLRELAVARSKGEGGHMSCTSGRIVSIPNTPTPFKAVMIRDDGSFFEKLFATMGEAEAYIRRNTPIPPVRGTTYDHSSG